MKNKLITEMQSTVEPCDLSVLCYSAKITGLKPAIEGYGFRIDIE